MNEPAAVVLYFSAILLAIAYTSFVGRWVQRQHNRRPLRGCGAMAVVVAATAILTYLVALAIGRMG